MEFFLVDAFTSSPFGGVVVPVYVLPAPREDDWMQQLVYEIDVADTAFLLEEKAGVRVRTFTPDGEVDLSVRSILASTHVLRELGRLDAGQQVVFATRASSVTARVADDWLNLELPAAPDTPCAPPDDLLQAIGAPLQYVGRNQLDYLVELDSESTLRALRPDLAVLSSLACRGVIVTAASVDTRFDFVSRYFAPQSGLPEDAVTASAHCCLGPFWQRRTGRDMFIAYQASTRGGIVRVEPRGAHVSIGGQAVTIIRGHLAAM